MYMTKEMNARKSISDLAGLCVPVKKNHINTCSLTK